jgi:hypothetical protein
MPDGMKDFFAEGAAMRLQHDALHDAVELARRAAGSLADDPGAALALDVSNIELRLHRLATGEVGVHIVKAPNVHARQGRCFAFAPVPAAGAKPVPRWIRRATINGPRVGTPRERLEWRVLDEVGRNISPRLGETHRLDGGVEVREYHPTGAIWPEHKVLVWSADEARDRPLLTGTVQRISGMWELRHAWTPSAAGAHADEPIEVDQHTMTLRRMHIRTFGDLLCWDPEVISRHRRFGAGAMQHLRVVVAAAGIEWVDGEH